MKNEHVTTTNLWLSLAGIKYRLQLSVTQYSAVEFQVTNQTTLQAIPFHVSPEPQCYTYSVVIT